jgi:hypothetical protein
VPGDLLAVAGFDHCLLNPPRQFILGEGGKSTREGGQSAKSGRCDHAIASVLAGDA